MKLLIAAILIIVLQSSCSTTSHFVTPDEVSNISSTVYLIDGTAIEGHIFVTSNLWGRESVKIKKAEGGEIAKLNIEDLKGYRVNDDYFDLKEIPTGLGKGYDYSFMKRLTAEGSRIKLYEHTRKSNLPDKTRPFNAISKEYFVQLPGEKSNIVWKLNSPVVKPYFNGKLEEIDNCPEKDKHYIPHESFGYQRDSYYQQKKVQHVLHLINEYNNCK